MREATLTKRVMAWLKSRPGSWTLKVSLRYHAGVPDILHIEQGLVTFIELKAPARKPTKLQRIVMRAIRAAGVAAYWCDSLEAVQALVERRHITPDDDPDKAVCP